MSFRVDRDEFLMSLEEIRRHVSERERQLRDLANYAVKVKDYTAEAIHTLTSEILELEKILTIYIAAQLSR